MLLLPLWRSILPVLPSVVMVLWRAPLAVARSLRPAQGFTVSLGLALWERYTRDALAALAGERVYVMRYEESRSPIPGHPRGVAHWLADRGAMRGDRRTMASPPRRPRCQGRWPATTATGAVPEERPPGGGGSDAADGAPGRVCRATDAVRPPGGWHDAIAQRRDYEELYARYCAT